MREFGQITDWLRSKAVFVFSIVRCGVIKAPDLLHLAATGSEKVSCAAPRNLNTLMDQHCLVAEYKELFFQSSL